MTLHPELKRLVDKTFSLRSKEIRRILFEKRRIRRLPRFQPGSTTKLLDDQELHYSDSLSLLSSYQAIFEDGIYDFECPHDNPRIIDCGANIGLATIFFKQRYPNAQVIAFEADPAIFQVLEKNCQSQGLTDVELHQQAVWIHDGQLNFQQNGADAGKVSEQESTSAISIPCVSLIQYLQQPVDLLKIDIEGAESDVLHHCRSDLANVNRIFVEYHSYVDRPQKLSQLITVLEQAGFHHHIQPELFSRTPFMERRVDEGMDNRINIYAVRK